MDPIAGAAPEPVTSCWQANYPANFSELKNPAYFRQVDIVYGAVTWPHEQDIEPETLLAEMTPVQDSTAWN